MTASHLWLLPVADVVSDGPGYSLASIVRIYQLSFYQLACLSSSATIMCSNSGLDPMVDICCFV